MNLSPSMELGRNYQNQNFSQFHFRPQVSLKKFYSGYRKSLMAKVKDVFDVLLDKACFTFALLLPASYDYFGYIFITLHVYI